MSLANRTIDLASKQVLVAADGTAAAPSITNDGDTNTGMFFPAADTIAFSEGGTESMRIDSSGRVGIGTTSPSLTLDINAPLPSLGITATTGTERVFARATNTGGNFYFGIDSSTGGLFGGVAYARTLHSDGAYPIAIYTNATERLRIDSSGNVGIGVTPSAWGSSFVGLQVGGASSIWTDKTNGLRTFLTTNAYFDGTNRRYLGNGAASDYLQASTGEHIFYTAGSGTAGSTVTFTERLRIDSSGRVGIGTSSPSYPMDIVADSNAFALNLRGRSVDNLGYIRFSTNNGATNHAAVGTPALNTLALDTNSTERLRIDSSGRVGIGTSSPQRMLHISGGESDVQVIQFTSNTTGNTSADGTSIGVSSGNDFQMWNWENGYIRFGTGNTERLRITSAGEVYIAGTTDQGAYNLQVNGTGVWGAGAYVNGSDERLKENIQDITSGLDVVEKLRPVSFQYKEEYTADRSVQSGFIAQDLLVALDGKNYLEGVVSQGPTYYNVAYQNLIPILAKAIQELKTINNSQAQTITSLESRITALEAA